LKEEQIEQNSGNSHLPVSPLLLGSEVEVSHFFGCALLKLISGFSS